MSKEKTANHIVKMRKLALQLCAAVPFEQRENFLLEWDDSTAPYLGVDDLKTGKADEILDQISDERALIVAAFNMDRTSKNKLK